MKNVQGLIAAIVLVGLISVSAPIFMQSEAGPKSACSTDLIKAAARQEIEYLQRGYAKATDLLGITEGDSFDKGRDLYRTIFTADANFSVSGEGAPEMNAVGPDAWADIVAQTLGPMGPTQHLTGTQRVSDLDVQISSDCKVTGGTAGLETYLQAWHDMPNDQIWMFMGTYVDDVVYVQGKGWQISKMDLVRTTTETRNKLSD
jgi:hypothetical protein